MQIPEELQLEIDRKIANIPLADLKRHSEALSSRYKDVGVDGICSLTSDYQRLAYISVRMPATYATIVQTLNEAILRSPSLRVESVLDIGAGPGTGLWAFKEFFHHSLKKVSLLEKDPAFIRLGKELAPALPDVDVQWQACDVALMDSLTLHDLVIASFSLGELHELDWKKTFLTMWKATKKILVVIEPGTPKGFDKIRKMRQLLLDQGANLVAPCPHIQKCPMQGSDWCHFAARIERTSIHRQIKNGTMNYEDEKFSYLIFSREAAQPVSHRVLSRPQKLKACVKLKLCSTSGVEQVTISRKLKEKYRLARKAEWGDIF